MILGTPHKHVAEGGEEDGGGGDPAHQLPQLVRFTHLTPRAVCVSVANIHELIHVTCGWFNFYIYDFIDILSI